MSVVPVAALREVGAVGLAPELSDLKGDVDPEPSRSVLHVGEFRVLQLDKLLGSLSTLIAVRRSDFSMPTRVDLARRRLAGGGQDVQFHGSFIDLEGGVESSHGR